MEPTNPAHPGEEQLLSFLAGTLQGSALEAVDQHLDACGPCRRLVAALASADNTRSFTGAAGVIAPNPSPERVGPRLRPGDQVGRFIVRHALAQGGMGEVYAALDPMLDRGVALKLVKSELEGHQREAFGARLLKEAQVLAQLSHPNVVSLHDAGLVGRDVFIAMELVEGGTLRDWLLAPRQREAILDTFLQAGRGLAAAHSAGIVHRDFKPANVLVGADGRVRVTDFGLARAREDGGAEGATTEGRVLGTPRYMAPEQYDSGAVDARTDQFSFCVALHEALTGEHPYGGGSMGQLRAALLAGRPRKTRGGVPRHIRRALLRGVSVSPQDRYASMDELLAALGGPQPRVRNVPREAMVALALVGVLGGAVMVGRRGFSLHASPSPSFVAQPTLPKGAEPQGTAPLTASALTAEAPSAAPEKPPASRRSHPAAPARRLRKAPATLATAPAKLSLVSDPPSRVMLNGVSLGATPLREVPVAPGHHLLRLLGPGGEGYLLGVELDSGLTSSFEVSLDALPRAQ